MYAHSLTPNMCKSKFFKVDIENMQTKQDMDIIINGNNFTYYIL